MKKLLILALASAIAAASNAAGDWFKVEVSGSTQTPTGAKWSTTPAAADVANDVISIDADVDTALELTPDALSPDAQTNTVVTVEATFTAVSDADSLESLGTDAKTALTVAKDGGEDYYYYWNGQWNQIPRETATPTSDQVTVRIELDNTSMAGTTATIKVGETTVATVANASTKTKVRGLAFAGTGKIGNINADYTKADASYDGIYYATVGGAIAAKGANSGDITLYKYNGSFGTMPTDDDKLLYFPASVNGNTARLYSFTKVDGDYQITSVADLKALVDLTAYDNTAYSFKQTTDLTLTEAWPGIGIQNGKDLATGNATQKAEYEAGAFKGIYDGGNKTISGFQMQGGGLDYCGFFNSTYGATIKNLKIQYAGTLFAADTTASTKESGATFVGVAKSSTLQNLTSLPGTVSCSKGFGGIAGYVTLGTTINSCTNNVNITSLAPNKAGGIAMILQQDGNADTNVLRNCQNNGSTTGTAEHGGLVGYVQAELVIDGCESTVQDQLLNHYSHVIVVQGVNKANANSVSYIKHSSDKADPVDFDGLHFATVDGNVATFVADDALEAGKTYKVMAEGAAATYAFTDPGSIAFDKALVPNFEPTISAATGLELTSSDSGTVTTYTAAVQMLAVTVAPPTGVAVAKFEYSTDGGTTWTEVAATPYSVPYGATVKLTYAADGEYVLSGGTTETFENAVTAATKLTPSAVTAAPAVAKIGTTTYYATLAEALANAVDGDKVTLLQDIAVERTYVSKTLTLDLGAKTLTGRLTIDNGTVTVQNGTVAGRFDAYDSSVVTLAATATVNGPVVVWGDGTYGEAGCKTPTLNVYGSVSNTGDGEDAISCNGTDKSRAVINIYDGASVVSTDDVGVFLPSGVLTVYGGTITGATGIYAKSGSVTVTGGTITGNGAKTAYVYRGDGATPTGDAIVIDNAAYPNGTPAVSITGGEFTSVNADAVASYAKVADSEVKNFVSGGTFSSSVPVEFCAAGFIPAQSGSTYGVEAGWKITWDVDGVKTVDTVKNGENLTKPADPTKIGYEFTGWDSEVVNTPNADATYTATWEQTAVPVVSTADTTLVAVPTNCTAATLIDLSNRAAGDELKVYVSSVGKYYAWKLTGEPLAWSPMNVASGEGASATVEESPAADTVPLRRGQAAWVTRTTSSDILLKGQYSADDLTVSVEKGWNLVAPTTKESFSLNSITPPNDGDKIVVPQTTALRKIYTYDATNKQWGYTDSKKVGSFKGKDVVETFINYEDATIPVGTGFWYVTDANEDVQLQKKGNE